MYVLASHLTFFLSCMNGKTSKQIPYTGSVKLSCLFKFLAQTPCKLELSVVHGHIQIPKNQATDTLVWRT